MKKIYFILFFALCFCDIKAETNTNTNNISIFDWFQDIGSLFSSIFSIDLNSSYLPIMDRPQSAGGGGGSIPDPTPAPKPIPSVLPPIPYSNI